MRIDLRTALVVLAAVALGYVICLAMPVAQADVDDPMVIDRLVVNEYIEFANGVRLFASGDALACDGELQTPSLQLQSGITFTNGNYILGSKLGIITLGPSILVRDGIRTGMEVDIGLGGLLILGKSIISPRYVLQNLTLNSATISSNGGKITNFNADLLDGYSAEDFVLKDTLPQCFRFDPEVKPPLPKQ